MLLEDVIDMGFKCFPELVNLLQAFLDITLFTRFQTECFISLYETMQYFFKTFAAGIEGFSVLLFLDILRDEQCLFCHLLGEHALFPCKVDTARELFGC